MRSVVSRFAELLDKRLNELDSEQKHEYREQPLSELLEDLDGVEGYTLYETISCDSGVVADVLVHLATKLMMAHDNFVMEELEASIST